jgi:hypothetical protein
MRVSFTLYETHYPKTHAEWEASANRFVITTVRIESCTGAGAEGTALVGKLVKYKGTLPSLAPYIVFHAGQGQCALKRDTNEYRGKKTTEQLLVASNHVKFTFTQRLTKADMAYIFNEELPRVTGRRPVPGYAQHWVQQHVASGALRIDAATGHIDPACLTEIEPFNTADDLFGKATDFARLGLLYPISKVYTGKFTYVLIEARLRELQLKVPNR